MLPTLFLFGASLALAEPEPESEAPAPASEAEAPEPTSETEAPEAEPVVMPAGPDLPSALDDPTPVSLPEDDGSLADILGHWQDQRRTVWSSGNFVRPTVALLVHEDVKPVTLGLRAGRRWWQLKDGLRAGIQTEGRADFGLAKARGTTDLGLNVLGGPYLSVVGLQLGPGIGWSQWKLGRDRLAAATGIDAVAMLVVDLRLVGLYGAVAPRWLVTGDRPAADVNPLGLGDELNLQAGAALNLGGLRLGVGWTRYFSAIGTVDRYALNLRILLF